MKAERPRRDRLRVGGKIAKTSMKEGGKPDGESANNEWKVVAESRWMGRIARVW